MSVKSLLIASHPARQPNVHRRGDDDLAESEGDPLAQLILTGKCIGNKYFCGKYSE
jgi:hypothetical protein